MGFQVNYLAVVVTAIFMFGLGAVWYSPALFGRKWQKLVGKTDDDLKKANMKEAIAATLDDRRIAPFFRLLYWRSHPRDLALMKGFESDEKLSRITGLLFCAAA